MDSGLDKNHSAKSISITNIVLVLEDSQLGVLVGTVSLEVLSDRDGLLDEVVEILGDGWGET